MYPRRRAAGRRCGGSPRPTPPRSWPLARWAALSATPTARFAGSLLGVPLSRPWCPMLAPREYVERGARADCLLCPAMRVKLTRCERPFKYESRATAWRVLSRSGQVHQGARSRTLAIAALSSQRGRVSGVSGVSQTAFNDGGVAVGRGTGGRCRRTVTARQLRSKQHSLRRARTRAWRRTCA